MFIERLPAVLLSEGAAAQAGPIAAAAVMGMSGEAAPGEAGAFASAAGAPKAPSASEEPAAGRKVIMSRWPTLAVCAAEARG